MENILLQNQKIILAETSSGSVFQKGNCKVIHLEFGNFLLKFTLEPFSVFREFVEKIDTSQLQSKNEDYKRKILVKMPCGVTLAFSEAEIFELRKLLREAEFLLSLKQIIQNANYSFN
ncbi:hypothetical protein IT568_08730 [bacterium]|nr:hypothetical protein [bacterium]